MADQPDFVYDASNEALVIGAAIADPAARRTLVHKLSADEFLVPKHALIWRVLREITDRGLEYSHKAAVRIVIDEGGGADVLDYLSTIEAEATLPQNLEWHADTMAWDATRARTLQGPIPEMLRLLNDPKAQQSDVLSIARAVSKALEGSGRRAAHRPAEIYRNYRAEIAARRARRNVYPLGAAVFDVNLTEGFMPRRTTVTAGLPGAGKSTLWIAFAILLAKAGRRVHYGAWEMDAESLLDVAVSHLTGIPLKSIVQGDLTDEEAKRIDRATRWIVSRITFMDNPFYDDRALRKKPSNDRNLDVLEGYIAESGCDVAIYDLWERMLPWRRPEDVSGALFRMQAMHQEYGVHGVIVQQLTLKDVEKRRDKRPTRDAIKGTGAYVEVADLIFGVHRDGQFKSVEDDSVETICLKQRKGRANWAVRWRWDAERCQVDSPQEVAFDPGLESSVGAGDVGRSIKDTSEIRSGPGRIGRRNQ